MTILETLHRALTTLEVNGHPKQAFGYKARLSKLDVAALRTELAAWITKLEVGETQVDPSWLADGEKYVAHLFGEILVVEVDGTSAMVVTL